MTPEEFDLNFDFDKLYDQDPNTDKCSFDDDFDLDAALERELGPDFNRLFEEEYAASQAALNAQMAARQDLLGDTQIRLEIGHEESWEQEEPQEEEVHEEDARFHENPDDPRENPILGGFMDLDDDEDEDQEAGEADEDLSDLFTAVTSHRESFFEEGPEPQAEEEPEEGEAEKESKLKAITDKIDLSGVSAAAAAAGAVIKDNAQRFWSALKECKPGKMDRKAKRRFKDDVLPVFIGGAALIVCMVFIIGSLSRNLNSEDRKQAALEASIAQAEAEAAAAAEIKNTLNTAAVQAAGYDYQAAINTLDAYKTEDRGLTEEMTAARAEYAEAVNNLVIWDDPTTIANLSFHVLIQDPDRAYADSLAGSYKSNFITTAQFSQILEQLYEKNFVLVNLNSCLTQTTGADGSTTYTVQPIYLPEGKTPIMITETLVNYFAYMVDSNKDGTPDADSAGFANKLVLENGQIKAAYVDADGSNQVGDYDLVPILNSFIEAHPDFSYRGAKAILAVTGEEGVFGWRTNTGDASVISGAKELVEALKADGYQIASNSYGNLDYGSSAVDAVKSDLSSWEKDVAPILGDVDILVVARGGEMVPGSNRFQAAYESGFRCILDAGSQGTALENGTFYQNRIMVVGSQLQSAAYANFFTLASN